MPKRGQSQPQEPAQAPAEPAPAAPMFAGAPGANRWDALKQRYALTNYPPYADAVTRLQPISDKLAESTNTVNQLRAEAEQLRQAATHAETEAMDARAGLLLGMGSEAVISQAQQKAEAAQLRATEALARLKEAEQVHAVIERACSKVQEELRQRGQAAKEHLQPQIRQEHETAVRRVSDAFRELSAALAAEQDIRDAVDVGPVSTLFNLGDQTANVRQYIHTETLHELEWFIRLDTFRYGQWIDGFRQKGYPVD